MHEEDEPDLSAGPDAELELFREVYGELHAIAKLHMAKQDGAHTLQPTALVNEVYLKLRGERPAWNDRAHFFRLASRCMRQILIDHARKESASKRSADGKRVGQDELVQRFEERSGNLLEIEAALVALEKLDPELGRIVELRFFGGRTMIEIAEILGIPERTVGRRWTLAKMKLRKELEG
jgi:RNA polymerase sigma factor (TIGR02999 family)